jgi:hypothetical protein
MSYQSQAALEADYQFQQRNRACAIQQAGHFKDDQRADIVALAESVARGDGATIAALTRMAAAGPGIADQADTGDGIDSSLVLDADILALTQANWPTVAALYFDVDGTPLDGTL